MTAIPLVTVRAIAADAKAPTEQLSIPAVLLAPLRADIVHFVHTNMAKNARQPYAVTPNQGHEHSAESWGTGRAVARVPRVSGGGNSRSGQAAFANMCRKGRMFGHTKTWRKWHRKINTNQKRFAVASALAATAEPALVLARGHRISNVPQIPLVIDNAAENITKTKQAVAVLQAVGAYADVEKARESRKVRAGSGKARNRRHVMRRGPLVIYSKDGGITRALRNLPGVESAQVERLNLLQLAPGGHLGRFVIFTKDAFAKLNSIFGSKTRESNQKSGYKLPQNIMNNADLTRIINSDEIQSKVRPAQRGNKKVARKKNPLTNLGALVKLNPFALQQRRSMLLTQARQVKAKAAKVAAARASEKAHRSTKKANYNRLITDDHSGVVERADLVRKAAKEEAKKKEEAAKKAAAESSKVGGKKKIKLIKEKRIKSAGGKGGKGGKGKVEAGKGAKGKEAAKGAAKAAPKAAAKK